MDKVTELKQVVGLDCSCNGSPTLRARLLWVEQDFCTLEVTPTMYMKTSEANKKVGERFRLPTEIVHNMYFF